MDEKVLAEIVNKAVENATSSLREELASLKNEARPKNESIDYVELGRKDFENKELEKQKREEIEKDTRFNLEIEGFLEENKAFLPENAKNIYESIKSSNLDNNTEKRKEIQRSLVLSTFQKENALQSLIKEHREKIQNFFEMTASSQKKHSNEVWEILKVYIDKNISYAKQAKLDRINSGLDIDDERKNSIQTRFNNAYKFFFKQDSNAKVRILSKN